VVVVPRWLGALPRIATFVPYRVRDALGPGRTADAVARETYEHRISRQYGVKDGQ
jgi:hypothetical protein